MLATFGMLKAERVACLQLDIRKALRAKSIATITKVRHAGDE